MSQFIFFLTHNGNKDLLKEEIRLFHRELTPSFSKKGFLTYKNNGTSLSQNQIQGMNMAFAIEWGESIEKLESEFINSKLDLQKSTISLPENAPSRAYLKIAEACEKFNIPANPKLNWIECGSSPGGASLYLLNNFYKVYGVDPGKMNSVCTTNPNFVHIQEAVQKVNLKYFRNTPIHWITSDLNLNPSQAIAEVLRLSKSHKRSLLGILMTIKMVKLEDVELIPKFEKMFRDFGFKKIERAQLPSHKREFLLYLH